MERYTDIDQSRVEYWRAEMVTASPAEDGDLDPLDRRMRADVCLYEHVEGEYDPGAGEGTLKVTWLPTALKRDDDLILFDVCPVRVIGPARGRTEFMAYCPAWFGDQPVPFQLAYITDRAPADPNETPMPIVPAVQLAAAASRAGGGGVASPKARRGDALDTFEAALGTSLSEHDRKHLVARARKHLRSGRP